MTVRLRYFANPFPDYSVGAEANTDWRDLIEIYITQIWKKQPARKEFCDGGLYTGCAGIGYMFLYLAHSTPFSAKRADYLEKAKSYVDVSLDYFREVRNNGDAEESFLCGAAGVYVLGSCVYRALKQDAVANDLESKYRQVVTKVLRSRSDEVFVGRAGWLAGLRLLRFFDVDTSKFAADAQRVASAIIDSGRSYNKRSCPGTPLMYSYYSSEYLGAAHGLSGIVQQLLEAETRDRIAGIRLADETLQHVRGAIDYLISVKLSDGNYPPSVEDIGTRQASEELLHFCHGAPGVVYLLAKAAVRFGTDSHGVDERYYAACVEAGELIWKSGLLRKGAGICHGVAGSGYVFLLLRRLAILRSGTADCQDAAKYLYRARKFAEFLLSSEFKQARTPDNPYSLFEGLAGTICYLCDLMQPDAAQFPLFDVHLK